LRSPERGGASAFRLLLGRELRELAASRSYWLLLLVIGALVGHEFITSVGIYAEASGRGGGPAALSQGLSPLEGIVVPILGAYDLAATLLFPFVVIRLFASEKQTGALALSLQLPVSFNVVVAAKALALVIAWIVAGTAGLLALILWSSIGGHLYAPETSAVVLGHLLRGMLTIGIAAAAAALSASAASAAIIALTFTLGTWALDYVAAARGGAIATIAAYTPSAALRVFEHGELRVATVLILLTLTVAGLRIAAVWLQEGRRARDRGLRVAAIVIGAAVICAGLSQVRGSRDVSEDRRNSFPRADEAALSRIHQPLNVMVYLAAEDPRLVDLEHGVLSKLARTMDRVTITYAARSRTGLFEKPDQHYGEVWYELGGRREMNRSSTEPIVLETIYKLAGISPPAPIEEPAYRGYPLAAQSGAAPWVFFLFWPAAVIAAWWWIRRSRLSRVSED
jgi:ABC-2 type transport system permease protein